MTKIFCSLLDTYVFIEVGPQIKLYGLYENSVRTSQETHYVSATKPNRLMLFREMISVYCENHTEHINTLCGQNVEFLILDRAGMYIVNLCA
jgi:predicted Zn-dependent protease with MMP-like domain